MSSLSWHFSAYIANEAAPVELIFIDNGSTDQTPAILGMYKEMYQDKLQIITNTNNLGFGEANNQAIDVAKGEALLFLNNDVVFNGPYLHLLDESLHRFPDSLHGPQHIGFDTGWNSFEQGLVRYLGGWCLAMTKETFETLGRFDSRYAPADFEDVDLCFTATKQGRGLFKVDLPLFHIADQTAPIVLPNRREITIRNRQRFAEKWGLTLGISDNPKGNEVINPYTNNPKPRTGL